MRIRFNNFFKLSTKERNARFKMDNYNKAKKKVSEREPVLKVYSGGGQIIKYEPYKVNNRCNEDVVRRRKGAGNVCRSFDSGVSSQVRKSNEIGGKVVEKYKDEYSNDSVEVEKQKEKCKVKRRRRGENKSAYLLFLFMLILAGCSLSFSYNNYKNLNQEDYAVYNSIDEEKPVLKSEEQSSVSNNLDTIETEEIVKTPTVTTNNTTKTKNQVLKVTPLSFAKPLDGEVLKIYSKDKVIYSKTLELWKTHDGIDIKADENTIVKAIEKGTVEKIYDDSFYGKTIVIDHGQGYKSSYSNLSEEVFVKEKQVVTKLAKIGKVGKTAIGEIKDDSHLHFTLIKNNEICDPSSIFK